MGVRMGVVVVVEVGGRRKNVSIDGGGGVLMSWELHQLADKDRK